MTIDEFSKSSPLRKRVGETTDLKPRGSSFVRGDTSTPLWRKTIFEVLQDTAAKFGNRDAAIFCQQWIGCKRLDRQVRARVLACVQPRIRHTDIDDLAGIPLASPALWPGFESKDYCAVCVTCSCIGCWFSNSNANTDPART
jgi:hypothetical protein